MILYLLEHRLDLKPKSRRLCLNVQTNRSSNSPCRLSTYSVILYSCQGNKGCCNCLVTPWYLKVGLQITQEGFVSDAKPKRCQATGLVVRKAIDICLVLSILPQRTQTIRRLFSLLLAPASTVDLFYDQVFGNEAVVCFSPARSTEWNKLGYSTHVQSLVQSKGRDLLLIV